jgi:hypothetical protein
MTRRYWGYRIDTNNTSFFRSELEQQRLRQGWGYDEGQDLRVLTVDKGAKRNLSILKKVKKGDILLVPRLPNRKEVAIVEALEDFKDGYRFEIDSKLGDYGHIFPAKMLKSFDRNNQNVSGQIRATIKNISRFWSIDHCAADIEILLNASDSDLKSKESFAASFSNAVDFSFTSAFDSQKFEDELYASACQKFSNEEWEYALVAGLKTYFPEPCVVERTGGITEAQHGTDILIRLPSLLGVQYLIAVQVKDYVGVVSNSPIKQICKADTYANWNSETSKVIEKILILTKATEEANTELLKSAASAGVRVIFADELKKLLASIGQSFLGLERS